MAINKKLIHFKTKENFENEVANGNILDNSIVFIQDSKEISTHGTVYKSVNWSVLGPELITFTIIGKSYQAEEGMTWGEWVNSDYNTGGFYSNNNFIYDTSGITVLTSTHSNVLPNDIIYSDQYIIKDHSGGIN